MSSAPLLPADAFLAVVRHAPLVAVDLIIENDRREVLLGLRNNRPARHYWFVPGGRIRKNETIRAALERVSRDELAIGAPPGDARLIGAYDHRYDDNYAGVAGVGTHYVVLAFRLTLPDLDLGELPLSQHRAYRWFPVATLLEAADVHPHVKAYFASGRK